MKLIIPTIVLVFFAMVATAQQDAANVSSVADEVKPESSVAPAKAVEQLAAGLWLAIGPDMQMLPTGTYRFIFVPSDAGSTVEVTTITTGAGGPGPAPVPPVGDLSTKTAATLANVTEAGKKTTATALLTVFEETNKSIVSGSLTDQTQVSAALNLVLTYATAGKAGWSDFVKLAGDTLTASTSIKATEAALKVFITELKKL